MGTEERPHEDEDAAATSPGGTLALDFRLPGLRGDELLLQLPVWGTSLRPPQQVSVSLREGQQKILQENGAQVRWKRGQEGQTRGGRSVEATGAEGIPREAPPREDSPREGGICCGRSRVTKPGRSQAALLDGAGGRHRGGGRRSERTGLRGRFFRFVSWACVLREEHETAFVEKGTRRVAGAWRIP